jgi:hypothetical protein
MHILVVFNHLQHHLQEHLNLKLGELLVEIEQEVELTQVEKVVTHTVIII